MNYNNFSIQNQIAYEKLMDNLDRMRPAIEKAEKLKELIEPISTKIEINPSINDISNSFSESIPNLRAVSMNIRENLSPFLIHVEQLMQALDFPVVQPVITKEQLKKKIYSMEQEKQLKVQSAAKNVFQNAPKAIKEKLLSKFDVNKILGTAISKTVGELLINFFMELMKLIIEMIERG